mmetsp:Transcript_45057/g.130365  ORF Transcript_45057/g.130365 Transcript_45057/m.130365 type:complete len:198 (+) Transcript_45057:851-1444(+)
MQLFTSKHASPHAAACADEHPASSNGEPANTGTTKLRRLVYLDGPMVEVAMLRLGQLLLLRLRFQRTTQGRVPCGMRPMYGQRASAHACASDSRTAYASASDTGAAHASASNPGAAHARTSDTGAPNARASDPGTPYTGAAHDHAACTGAERRLRLRDWQGHRRLRHAKPWLPGSRLILSKVHEYRRLGLRVPAVHA